MRLNWSLNLFVLFSFLAFRLSLCDAAAEINSQLTLNGTFSKNEQSVNCADTYTLPKDQQCQFVKEHCSSSDHLVSKINYLQIYYCHFNSLHFISMIPLVIGLITCFISLGITASDFLCPNLYTISKFLKLSDNLAGLTLLALGNGAPDVLSTYKAINVGLTDLAISELMGASLFITTVIIGSMAIIKPFSVPNDQFIRDVSFYLGVCVIVFISILWGNLTLINCILLLSTYIIYVVFVISNHTLQKLKIKKQLLILRSRSNYTPNVSHNIEGIDDIYLDNIASLPSIDELDNFDVHDVEFDNFLKTHDHDANTEHIPVHTGSYALKTLVKELSKHATHHHKEIFLDDNHHRPLTAPGGSSRFAAQQYSDEDIFTPHTQPNPYNDDPSQSFEIPSQNNSSSLTHVDNSTGNSNVLHLVIRFWKLLTPDFDEFFEADFFNKCNFILCFPASVLLKSCTPVRDQFLVHAFNSKPEDESEEDFDFRSDKLLFLFQTVIAVNFIILNIWGLSVLNICICFAISGVSFIGTYSLYKINQPSQIVNYIGSVVGFITSISWISIFATEIIGILKAFSVIFHLSDSILGITVFALGNSVGDLISNLTITKMGMPIMAFGACFGGPLLSLCSLGLIGIIILSNDGTITIGNLKTLTVTSGALVINVLVILISVPRNSWMLDRKIGSLLIVNWVLSTAICIILELI